MRIPFPQLVNNVLQNAQIVLGLLILSVKPVPALMFCRMVVNVLMFAITNSTKTLPLPIA